MKNNLVSIIIPAYNVSSYIKKCLDSILLSNNNNWETIIVDDGSTDNTFDICEKYARSDNRFRVFHKKNGGVSSARNYGLQRCNGKWVCFVDGDDYIDNNYLNLDGFEDCDLIRKSYFVVNDNNSICKYGYKIKSSKVYSNKIDIYKYYLKRKNFALWDLIISADIAKKYLFDEKIHIGEDMLYFLHCLENIKKYAISSNGAYYYLIRNDSAMHAASSSLKNRITICFSNINNVLGITRHYNTELGEALVAKLFLMELFNYRNELNKMEKKRLKIYFNSINYKSLNLLDIKKKIKFILKKIIIRLI